MTTRTLTSMAAGLLIVVGTGFARADGTGNFSGLASHYGKNYRGVTATGETYDAEKFTAAHRTLPFGTRLHVTGMEFTTGTGVAFRALVPNRGTVVLDCGKVLWRN